MIPRFIRIAWILIAIGALLWCVGCDPDRLYARMVIDAPAPKITISATVEVVPTERPAASPAKPGQADALRVVWLQQYEMGGIEPPTIVWMEGNRLDCGKGRAEDGRLVGGREANGGGRYGKSRAGRINHGWIEPDAADGGGFPPCVSGAFDPATFTIQLSWPPGTARFSTTSFAHELAHARTFRLMGYANHQGFDFAPRGRVYRADAALRKSGL